MPGRFREMDGMVFLPDQLVEYEKARSRIPQVKQAELFVSDERSAIDWLTNFLLKRPSTRSEIHPEYIPQIGSAKRKGEIIPELDQLLEDNFLRYDGTGEVPSQIHSYLSTNHKDLRGLRRTARRWWPRQKIAGTCPTRTRRRTWRRSARRRCSRSSTPTIVHWTQDQGVPS